jgi:hypothetical protein
MGGISYQTVVYVERTEEMPLTGAAFTLDVYSHVRHTGRMMPPREWNPRSWEALARIEH